MDQTKITKWIKRRSPFDLRSEGGVSSAVISGKSNLPVHSVRVVVVEVTEGLHKQSVTKGCRAPGLITSDFAEPQGDTEAS